MDYSIIVQYQEEIKSFCMKKLKDKPLSEDISGDVVLKFIEYYGYEINEEEKMKKLLFKMTSNLITDHFRKTHTRAKAQYHMIDNYRDNGINYEKELFARIELNSLVSAFENGALKLSPIESKIFKAVFIHNASIQHNSDIVEESGLTEKQVINQKKTLIKKIRKFLNLKKVTSVN